jgi:hypothetical protein
MGSLKLATPEKIMEAIAANLNCGNVLSLRADS